MDKIFKYSIHAIFWLVYLQLSATLGFRIHESTEFIANYFHVYIGNTIWAIISFYFAYQYLSQYIKEKRYWTYAGYTICSVIAITAIFFSLYTYVVTSASNLLSIRLFFGSLVGTFIISNCGVLVRGFLQWFDESRKRNELENKQLRLEMELLKSQLNPHFLFNTLNNIDSLIYKNQQQASDALIQLSELLNYMLYSGKQQTVNIGQEIQYVKNLVALHKLRHDEEGYISAHFPEGNESRTIAPLLLTPFVENAFKHSAYTGSFPVISIDFACTESQIKFTVVNTFIDQKQMQTGGIGLQNIRRRLEILYPNKHSLNIRKESGIFEAEMIIETKE